MLGMVRRGHILLLAFAASFAAPGTAHDLPEEVAQIARLMNLRPGMQVADVGAGNGEFAEKLASRLGDAGHVYVNEIDDGELNKIRKRLRRSDLTNMSVVKGETDDANLPMACCDAMLLRYVYHHMSNRDDMRSSLRRSLRPGGLLVVIEKEEPGDGVGTEELISEMSAAGFEVVSRHPEWGGHGDHYAVLFRRPDPSIGDVYQIGVSETVGAVARSRIWRGPRTAVGRATTENRRWFPTCAAR